MKVEEEDPYGIKNEQLRAIVKAKFERGENFHYRLGAARMPARSRPAARDGDERARSDRCPTLVVHAREDELPACARPFPRRAHRRGKRAGQARMVVLEDSYHMICVDNDREIVAKNVLEFFVPARPDRSA